jgi:hypothetical protein
VTSTLFAGHIPGIAKADGSGTEADDDVIGHEIDSRNDLGLTIVTTESFWRIDVCRYDVDQARQGI